MATHAESPKTPFIRGQIPLSPRVRTFTVIRSSSLFLPMAMMLTVQVDSTSATATDALVSLTQRRVASEPSS